MFSVFSRHKTDYRQGQVFPFMIAVIAVMITMLMITVNLGQIAVFKTDASNAADAGALAGASSLSSSMLELGLKNTAMMADALHSMAIALATILTIVIPIAIMISLSVRMWVGYLMAVGMGRMAWTKAKKNALQYAFKNLGIDEPRPSFETFVKEVWGVDDLSGLTDSQRSSYHSIYIYGDLKHGDESGPAAPDGTKPSREDIQDWTQTGLSRFLSDEKRGYAKDIPYIQPSSSSPRRITSRYAWNNEPEAERTNAFGEEVEMEYVSCWDNGHCKEGFAPGEGDVCFALEEEFCLKNYYDNWVEVTVEGASQYSFKPWSFIRYITGDIAGIVWETITDVGSMPWWLAIIAVILAPVTALIAAAMIMIATVVLTPAEYVTPTGFEFMPDEEAQTEHSPIIVEIKRYKANEDLGLWKFVYGGASQEGEGGVVAARSAAHIFDQDGCANILPPLMDPCDGWANTADALIAEALIATFPLAALIDVAVDGELNMLDIPSENFKAFLYETELYYTDRQVHDDLW